MIFIHNRKFSYFCLLVKDSHPLSKYNDSVEAKIGSPVTILATSSCPLSNYSISAREQPSHTTEVSIF